MFVVKRSAQWSCFFTSTTLFLCLGCGVDPSVPVSPDVARSTIRQVLEEWKSGSTIAAQRTANPPVVVQDMDWANGLTLNEYEFVGDGFPEGANLIAKVKLSLSNEKGTIVDKTVFYVIGTSPVLTVFRDPMRQ